MQKYRETLPTYRPKHNKIRIKAWAQTLKQKQAHKIILTHRNTRIDTQKQNTCAYIVHTEATKTACVNMVRKMRPPPPPSPVSIIRVC